MSRYFSRLIKIPFRTVEAWKSGHYNPSTLVRIEGDAQARLFGGPQGPHYLATKCGSDDDLTVFQQSSGDVVDVYVLVVNTKLPYLGVERFSTADEASDEYERARDRKLIHAIPSAAEVFYQGDEQIVDALDRRWEELGERAIIELLQGYL